METITLISSGVDKTWPVQVRGTHPLFGNQKVEPPLKSKPFSTSRFTHIFVCIKYLCQDHRSLFKAAVKGKAMPQLTNNLQKSFQNEIFEQKSKEGWNQPGERSNAELPSQKKQ